MRITTVIVPLLLAIAIPAFPSPHDDDQPPSPHSEHPTMDMPLAPAQNSSLKPSPASSHGGMHHGMPILQMPDLEPQQRAYWEAYNTTTFFNAAVPNQPFLWAHMVLTFIAWIALFPFVLMMGCEDHSLYLVAQTVQFAFAMAALVCLAIFGTSCPDDMYPGNAYSKMSVILFFYIIAHWLSVVVKELGKCALFADLSRPIDGADYVLANMSHNERRRHSNDSGHAYEVNEGVPFNSEQDELDQDSDTVDNLDYESQALPRFSAPAVSSKWTPRFLQSKTAIRIITRFQNLANIVFVFLHRPLFFYALSYFFTGIVTAFRLGIGHMVFNILAHFIKGGVFFTYGLLTLARYLGAFKNHGMAWNIRPGSKYDPSHKRMQSDHNTGEIYLRTYQRSGDNLFLFSRLGNSIPSIEFVECFLVFFYGSTNIFMEHLGNSSGVWDHKDLQHASIAFMYIGGGLCGLLVESKWAKKLCGVNVDEEFNTQHGFSFNPFPAFIVFWTGILMSKHQQELPLSTEIHSQWGIILVVGSIFRLFTYLLMYVNTPESTAPSRPFTELVVAFCLICGGMVFIESNSQTVEAMIYRGLDGMFVLNVNVGCAALIMAYEMVVLTFKGLISKDRAS